MIAKPILLHKLRVFKLGEELPFDTIYCTPENLHYWLGLDYEQDGERLLISKIWVSPSRFRQLFPE